MTLAWAVVLLAVFLIGLTKSGFGSGVGLMIVPMTVMGLSHTRFGGGAALGLMLPLLIAGDLLAVWQYRRLFSLQIVKKLLPGTAAGVLIGGAMLWWFHRQPLETLTALIRLEVGVEAVVLVSLHWFRLWRGAELHGRPTPLRSTLTGLFAGASSTLAHAAGPIIALYLLPMKLDRRLFVGTSAIYFAILNMTKLPAYGWSGQFPLDVLRLSAMCLPLVVVGALAGAWLNQRMDDRLFSRVVYAATFVLGTYLVFDGVTNLVRGT
jgi:uncharacterized membrane protein YfcA